MDRFDVNPKWAGPHLLRHDAPAGVVTLRFLVFNAAREFQERLVESVESPGRVVSSHYSSNQVRRDRFSANRTFCPRNCLSLSVRAVAFKSSAAH